MPDFNNDDTQDDLDSEADEDTGDAGDSGDQEKPDGPADKRIRDLQSKADAAEARANKLQKQLEGLNPGEGTPKGSNEDPERAALMAELRETSLDAVFAEFSELRDYGIDRSLIEGANRAQMRENANSLVALIKSVETKARNKTLREHGIKAEPAGGTRSTPKSYETMSDEDFEKEIARGRHGGASLW